MKYILVAGLCLISSISILPIYALEEVQPLEDTDLFQMEIYQGEQIIGDSLILWEDTVLEVSFTEDVKSVEVSIDGRPFITDIVDHQLWIPVSLNDSYIFIHALSQMGQSVERCVTIDAIQHLSATSSIKGKSYILEDHIGLYLDDICQENVEMQIRKDGVLINSIPCSGKKDFDIPLEGKGIYTLQFIYENYPNHHILIDGKEVLEFTFSDAPISLEIGNDTILSNQTLTIPIQWPFAMLEGKIEIFDGVSSMISEPTDTVLLEGTYGKDITYKVRAYAKDQFGREITIEEEFRIDKKVPCPTLYINDKPFEPDNLHSITSLKDIQLLWDEDVTWDIQCFINSNPVYADNLDALYTMLEDQDLLSIFVKGVDQAGNIAYKHYQIQYVEVTTPISTAPTGILESSSTIQDIKTENKDKPLLSVQKQDVLGNLQDVRKVERMWVIDEHENIVLEKNDKTIIDKTKPVIRLFGIDGTDIKELHQNEMLRLTLLHNQSYSEDTFECIRINGKNVDLNVLKRDRLHNLYYDFSITESPMTIYAKAKDQSGNVTTFQKTLNYETERNDWPLWIGIVLLTMGTVMLVCLRKRYGKNKDS